MNFHTAAIHRNIQRVNRLQALDRSYFTVLCRASDGDVYQAERIIKNPDRERDELILDIAQGQIENVMAVFEFNPVERWSTDISADIAQQVLDACGVTESCREFLEDQLGCEALAQVRVA